MPDSRNTQITVNEAELNLILLIRDLRLDANKIEALGRVARGTAEVQYGDIIIKMQAGKVVWVDKYERERVG